MFKGGGANKQSKERNQDKHASGEVKQSVVCWVREKQKCLD